MHSFIASWFIAAAMVTLPAIAQSEQKHFDSNGVKLHYVDEGSGTPVLLSHGYSGNLTQSWRKSRVIQRLVDANYRVIAYDHRGHGLSDKPHAAGSYRIRMVEDAKRLLDHLKINRCHLVGYSMGAVIANKSRQTDPDRLLSVTLAGYGQPPLPTGVHASAH